MKSKVLASVAALMAVGATCAFAANPFVDVPTDSWAYKSVVELADAGIIQGVDGQYFQGQRNITRYEAAEMVAKAMAHMDRATVEQRALINKLADEYADELNNLGVRVSNLENKVGNIKFTGDARLRYRYQDGNKDNDNSWDYRIRLRGKAQINDRMTATLGISRALLTMVKLAMKVIFLLTISKSITTPSRSASASAAQISIKSAAPAATAMHTAMYLTA